ncbi:MAG: signal peptidase II [Actinomycetota bacterium]|nr:signal peptidase II [Actinomycetota bacterium]
MVAVDQITKSAAVEALSDGPVDVIPGILTLRLHFNPGGAFGILQDRPTFFLVATIAVMGLILVWARGIDDRRLLVPLGLVLGGGAGNLADRILRDHDGRVVDFVDLQVWPLFNVADASIVVGVVLIMLLTLRAGGSEDDPGDASRTGTASRTASGPGG